jgi:hypothetical protein
LAVSLRNPVGGFNPCDAKELLTTIKPAQQKGLLNLYFLGVGGTFWGATLELPGIPRNLNHQL